MKYSIYSPILWIILIFGPVFAAYQGFYDYPYLKKHGSDDLVVVEKIEKINEVRGFRIVYTAVGNTTYHWPLAPEKEFKVIHTFYSPKSLKVGSVVSLIVDPRKDNLQKFTVLGSVKDSVPVLFWKNFGVVGIVIVLLSVLFWLHKLSRIKFIKIY